MGHTMTNKQEKRLNKAVHTYFNSKGIPSNIVVKENLNWVRNVLDLLNKYGLIHVWESYHYGSLDNQMFHHDPEVWAEENISVLALMFLIKSEHWFDEDIQEFSVAIDGTEVVDYYTEKTHILDILIDYTLKGYSIFHMDVIPFIKEN